MKNLIVVLLFMLLATSALAHGGGTNSCGGHNDRKRGGYHVHNWTKHCACNPDAAECKSDQSKPETKTKKKKATQ